MSLTSAEIARSRELEESECQSKESHADDVAESYASMGIWGRACPERYFALLVTLAIETPVSLLVGEGSGPLVDRIGLARYTLFMAFLPLTSAISGNVGLQASTLTTRAITTGHCTRNNLCKWFGKEVGAAVILAWGCGLAVFLLAFIWTVVDNSNETDAGFAVTIGLAQVFSITVAGITGTLAPVLFSFVLKRDSGKWSGPLETAVQDIAGTFAVVYVAQYILLFFIEIGVSPATPAA
jgi:magnesium transporter